MKKSLLAILFAAISFASALAATVGDTFTVGDGLYYQVTSTDPKEVAVVPGLTANMPSDLTIPAEVNGYIVTSIDSYAFDSYTSLTSIEIPASVTSIGKSAFQGCTSLTSIEIPASVTSIDNYTFSNCTSLTSIEIPSTVTSIGKSAFQGCTSLTSIEIPASVTSIDNYTFSNCTSLTSIEIPSSVTSIGSSAFNYCTSLTSIEIPASVTSIGSSAFYNCTSLTSITCLGTTPPTAIEDTFDNFDKSACTLNLPKDCAETYKNAPNWDGFKEYKEIGISTSIESLGTDVVEVMVNGNRVTVSGTDAPIIVYDLNGRVILTTTERTFTLPRGVTILKVAGRTNKLAI